VDLEMAGLIAGPRGATGDGGQAAQQLRVARELAVEARLLAVRRLTWPLAMMGPARVASVKRRLPASAPTCNW